LLKGLSTIGAKGKIPLHCPSAVRADILRRRSLKIRARAMLINDSFAVFAEQKWGAPFDRKQGDKEQAHVMVHPLEINLHMPAGRARPGLPINRNCFGLNPANKEEEHRL
jgi:hypothetical protein